LDGVGGAPIMQLKQANTEFLSGYFATNDRSNKTKAAYRSDLDQFTHFVGEGVPLSSLDSAVIEQWAGYLRNESYAPASLRRKVVTLKVFFSYWVRKGLISESPFWRVKLSFGRIQPLPRTLTETETKALLAQAKRDQLIARPRRGRRIVCRPAYSPSVQYRSLRNLALVELLFATGMRVGEVAALDIHDFSQEEAMFKVKGKGGRWRLAFTVDGTTLQVQRDHLGKRMRIETDSSALFLNASGNRLSTQGIANVIGHVRQRAGIERHVTPHMLRHTVATLLLRSGADIRVVQEFLGHASIVTTQRYTHITKEHLIGVLRKHHPSFHFRARIRRVTLPRDKACIDLDVFNETE
jgi:integrase/recombinase XerD